MPVSLSRIPSYVKLLMYSLILAKEGNFKEFTASLNSISKGAKSFTDRPLAVLEHVITRLLDREQKQKLQANIRPALEKAAAESGWSAWDSLYSPDEQISRLLGRIMDRNISACPEMPDSVKALYEEQLAMWLPEHPFLREGRQPANKVFESYLFATAMRGYLTLLSAHVEQRIASPDYKPSRLLADFYILIGQERGEEVVAEKQIGLLYDSLLAGESEALRVRLSVESGDPEEDDDDSTTAEGEFILVYSTPENEDGERIESRNFKIVESTGSTCFSRQLKDANVVTSGKVVLGGGVDDFEIGPSVDIRCSQIDFASAGLIVRGVAKPRDSDAVIIDAKKCHSMVSRKPVARGTLSVSWPDSYVFPWNDFSVATGKIDLDTGDLHEVYLRFRRIVYSLRSHSKGSLARFKDKVESRRVLKNDIGKALLQKLCADGILKLKDEFYHWTPERADALLKVSWHNLRNRQITVDMKRYFTQFIAANKNLF